MRCPCSRSCHRCRGGWTSRVRALRRSRQPSRPPSALRPSRRCHRHRHWRHCRSPRHGGHRHHPWHHPSSMRPPPRQLPCVGPLSLRAEAAAARPDGHRHWIRQRGEAPSSSLASSSTQPLPLLCRPCVGPTLSRARASRRRPLPCRRPWGHRLRTRPLGAPLPPAGMGRAVGLRGGSVSRRAKQLRRRLGAREKSAALPPRSLPWVFSPVGAATLGLQTTPATLEGSAPPPPAWALRWVLMVVAAPWAGLSRPLSSSLSDSSPPRTLVASSTP